MALDRDRANGCRFRRDAVGHYESWFCRANAPREPIAFWIRYTIFAPKGRPQDAVGERWAIVFDRTRDAIVSVKDVVPIAACSFAEHGLDVAIADATLDDAGLRGAAASDGHTIAWDLGVAGDEPPLLLFPERLYATALPRAKVLVGRPLARFTGTLHVDHETYDVEDWIGSVNHNWGSRHTDRYAWGQVAGFDEEPHAFLECSSARIKLGFVPTPLLSPLVLRIDGRDLAFNEVHRTLRARARIDGTTWTLETGDRNTSISMRMHASAADFVALRYDDPPGGHKTCLNSKLAQCELNVQLRGEPARTLTSSRAAFEILTPADPHAR